MSKPKTDPLDRLEPGEQEAIRTRQACDSAWLKLKDACTTWGVEWEYVDQIEQRAKIHLPTRKVLKVWRAGEAFKLALDDTVLATVAAGTLLEAALMVIRR